MSSGLRPTGSGRWRRPSSSRTSGMAGSASTTSPSPPVAPPRARVRRGSLTPTARSRSSSRPLPARRCARSAFAGYAIEAPGGAIAVERLRLGDDDLDARSLRPPRRRHRDRARLDPRAGRPPRDPPDPRRRPDGHGIAGPPARGWANPRRPSNRRRRRRHDRGESRNPVVYEAADTYDLVVSGETGVYLAGGIPLGSTSTDGSRGPDPAPDRRGRLPGGLAGSTSPADAGEARHAGTFFER